MSASNLVPAPGASAVLAVSGGLDSTVLARTWGPLLRRWGVWVHIAHVDHELRGAESDADRRAVEALGEELGFPVEVAVRPPSLDAVAEVGLEAALRCSRRQFLRARAEQVGAEHVYLAHHRDDQVETILLRLAEGVPPDRVVGMRPRSGVWCRPLLHRRRAELRARALREGWTWREDGSNAVPDRPRTHIRHVVVPARRAVDAGFEEALLAAAEVAALRRDARHAAADRLATRARLEAAEGSARLDVDALRGADAEIVLTLLRRLTDPGDLPRRPPTRAALRTLLELPGGKARRYDLGGGWTARLEGSELLLLRDALPTMVASAPRPRRWEGQAMDWPGGWRLGARFVSKSEAERLLQRPDAGRSFALFDAAGLARPLRIGAAVEAGRMRPFGGGGSAPVRRLLMDAGVPRSRRGRHPAVLDAAGNVLWVPEVRAGDHAPLDRSSTEALSLYTEQSPAPSQGQEPSGRDAETP